MKAEAGFCSGRKGAFLWRPGSGRMSEARFTPSCIRQIVIKYLLCVRCLPPLGTRQDQNTVPDSRGLHSRGAGKQQTRKQRRVTVKRRVRLWRIGTREDQPQKSITAYKPRGGSFPSHMGDSRSLREAPAGTLPDGGSAALN